MPRRSPSAPAGPDPVDLHVGQAIRRARRARGWSQHALAQRLSLSGQQLQKYESGANRVSASILFRLAGALDRPPGTFFPDAATQAPAPILSDEATALALAADRIASRQERRALMVLARALSRGAPHDAGG